MEQVVRFSTELLAPGGQGPCLIHLVSCTVPNSSKAVNKYWMKESLYTWPHSLIPGIKYQHPIMSILLPCFIFLLSNYYQLSCYVFASIIYYFSFSLHFHLHCFPISQMDVHLQCVHVWLYRLGTEQLYTMALNLLLPPHTTLAPPEGLSSPSIRKMSSIFLFWKFH